jgi:hypothetical protein
MRIDNVNYWLLMIRNEDILGEKPESVSVEFNTDKEVAILTAKFKDGIATQNILMKELEHLVNEEVKPNNNHWTRN